MKNILLIFATLFVFSSCSKEKLDEDSSISPFGALASKAMGYNLNSEGLRIAEDMQASKYELGVLATYNFGLKTNTKMDGALPNHNSVLIDGTPFEANIGGDNFLIYSDDLDNSVFGKMVTISAGNTVKSIYSPAILIAENAGNDNFEITRGQEALLKWNADPNNPTGQVVIRFKTYSGEEPTEPNLMTDDFLITEDDGSFDLSDLVNNEVHSLLINIGRGNGFKAELSNGDYSFVNVRSSDYHLYRIVD